MFQKLNEISVDFTELTVQRIFKYDVFDRYCRYHFNQTSSGRFKYKMQFIQKYNPKNDENKSFDHRDYNKVLQ